MVVDAGTPKLVVDQAQYDFKNVVTNGSAPVTLTFTNTGDGPTGRLSSQVTGVDASAFVVTTDGCTNVVLAAGRTCTDVLTFSPTAAQAYTATLTTTATPGGSPTVDLSGTGVLPGALSLTTTTHEFGRVDVGQKSATQTYTVKNTGGTVTGGITTTITDAGGDFVVTDGCKSKTLAATTGSCDIVVAFKPGSAGGKSLSIVASATPGGSVSAGATGTGVALFPLTVAPQGAGSGTITSAQSGITCGATCTANIEDGTVVTLTAVAATGSTFTGWSGGGCSGTSTCQVTMSAAQTVTAAFALQNFSLTVNRSYVGTATGTVASTAPSSPVIACGTTCTQTYPYGTVVTLSAQPGAGYYLQGFTGGITSTSYTPTVTVTGDTTVTATFTPPNKIFVTTAAMTGNLGGLAGADAECAAEATAAHLPGKFVAWLSTSTVSANTRLGAARGWVRTDGLPFGDSVALLTGGALGQTFYPPRLTASGTDVSAAGASYVVATGTQANGTGWTIDYTCADWTSASSSLFGALGIADGGNVTWTAGVDTSCDAWNLHLLCMETDYQAVVRVTPPPSARTIFLSRPKFDPSAGYAGASALCTSDANGVYPGTYKPLLATTSASIASGFTAKGVPLVRPDGVVVATTDTAFLAGSRITAPIELGPTGYADNNGKAFTGSSSMAVAGNNSTTCNNWSTKSSTASGISGVTNISAGYDYLSTTGYPPDCGWPMSVYCLQQ